MGESHDGPQPAARSAQAEAEAESPGRATFLSRLFRWDRDDDTSEERDEGGQVTGSVAHAGDMPVNLAKLKGMRVEDVAVPRADIVAVPVDADLDAVVTVFRASENTRLPVYRENLDEPIGIVHFKDLALRHGFGASVEPFDLRALVRPLIYVPHSMPIGVLLRKMQATRSHMALVIDEYGGVDGLVTLEDILEQVVGEIGDEHDADEGRLWQAEGEGAYLVSGRLDLDELEAETGIGLDLDDLGDEVDTVGGLATQIAGRVPEPGEVVAHPDGHEFEIVDADARRIKRMRLRLAPTALPVPARRAAE